LEAISRQTLFGIDPFPKQRLAEGIESLSQIGLVPGAGAAAALSRA